MSAIEDLHWLTATDLGERLARRELSPVEATEHALARIDALSDRLHAFTAVLADGALDAAKQAEAELGRGRRRGPLHGVPVAVKDLCDVAGVPTSAGTTVLGERAAERDSRVVESLRAAGAVLLGKLTLTEGAFAAHHPNVARPVNPWQPARWTGVSSSGSGVATAAGLAYATLGSDTGGSIRFPSAACGVTGLKPTYGRVSTRGVFPLARSLDHVGPMARSVRDVAAVFAAIAGADPEDPLCLDLPAPSPAIEGAVRGLRVGVDEAACRGVGDAEIVERVLGTADVLRDAGAAIVPVRLPDLAAPAGVWMALCAVEVARAHEGVFPERADEYGPSLRGVLEMGRELSGATYAEAHEERVIFSTGLAGVMRDVDAVLCPALPLHLPADVDPGAPENAEMTGVMLRFTAPFDMSGSPALTLPCGFGSDGSPVGFQLVGRHLEEATLLRLGLAYQERTRWHEAHPEL